jgi:hypothetical protein
MKLSTLVKNIEDFFSERRLLYIILTGILIIDLVILVFSNGYYGGADTTGHYLYSHWAFAHPAYLLNHWAKPVFTLLSAPFAAVGFKTFQLFNILVGIATGYISYLVAKELKMKSPLLAIVICCFTPIFMISLFSGLTEILFAFVAILASYLLIKERYAWGAIVVSILPLIRYEAIVLLPVYAIFLVNKKHYREILLMLTGIVFYSLIGAVAGKNIFWLFTEFPHQNTVEVYGKGKFFHYILRSPGFFGIPNEIFFVTGLVAGLSLYLREKMEYSKEFLLIVLPFLTYFFAHTVSWWLGIGGSQGQNRYMAAIVPFMAVMATRGLYLFAKMFLILTKQEWVRVFALIIGFISVFHIPFAVQNYPIAPAPTEKTVLQATNWVKQEGLNNVKFYYNDPTVVFQMNANPLDSTQCERFVATPTNLAQSLKNGELLIYDTYFTEMAGARLNELAGSSNLELLKLFEPEIPVDVYRKPYKVAVFKKTEPNPFVVQKNNALLKGEGTIFCPIKIFDFDSTTFQPESKHIQPLGKNGSSCILLKESREHCLKINFALDTLKFVHPFELQVSMSILPKEPQKKLRYVVEATSNGKQIAYKSYDITFTDINTPEEWFNTEFRIAVPEVNNPENVRIKTYIWNNRKGSYLIDNYTISYRIQ